MGTLAKMIHDINSVLNICITADKYVMSKKWAGYTSILS